MGDILFRNLCEDELYDAYIKALSWDTENKFTDFNKDEFDEFMNASDAYGLFLNDNLAGYGILSKFKTESNYCYTSYIINPSYRKKGLAKLLLECLLLELKKRKNILAALAEIDEDNIPSIFTVLDNGFSLFERKDGELIFKKNLDDII